MPATRYVNPRQVLFAFAFLGLPLTAFASASTFQQVEQINTGNGLRAPATRPASAGEEVVRPGRSGSAPANSLIRRVHTGPSVRAGAPVLAGAAALATIVREEGEDWLGTRYRYGGTTRRGIDCSAFVQTIMRDALDIELPRTTASQVVLGESVSRNELLPSDLVFFRRRGVRHVGIYLGDGEFIHASSSRGVTISNLTEGYYQRHFWTARRLVDNPRGFLPESGLASRGSYR